MKNTDRLFIGYFPGGVSYADRTQEQHGDYKRLGFLSYRTLELRLEKGCPTYLAAEIKMHAADLQRRKGELLEISTCGQTVRLGGGV
jgi:hypothetical protein